MFTYEQYMSTIRWLTTIAGTWLVSKGLGDLGIWTAVGGVALAVAPWVWSMIRHTTWGTILAANDAPDVAGVIMKNTATGASIARTTPSPAITVVGSSTAESLAKTGVP